MAGFGAAAGAKPILVAGHSLGEYSALVCAGALNFHGGLPLVHERARLMQAAVPEEQGAVAAILGPDNTQVIDLCSQAAQGQVVAEVNFNSPGQVVIAGDAAQRWRAMALASEIGAKRVMHLPVSVPAHCDLMIPAARRLAIRLAETRIRSADVRVVHSTDATSYEMLIPSNMRVSVSSTAPCAGWKPCEHSPRLGRQAFWSLVLEGV